MIGVMLIMMKAVGMISLLSSVDCIQTELCRRPWVDNNPVPLHHQSYMTSFTSILRRSLAKLVYKEHILNLYFRIQYSFPY